MFAGKTTAARFPESEGYAYTRISEVIDDVLRERGEQITRENQQRVGLELHEEKGQRWLCQRAIERLTGAPTRIVIDGLRWIEDIAYFRERYGGRFRHIHLDVPLSLRRERAERNGKLSMFEVARMHPVEQGIAKIATMAQDQIVNDGDLQGLYAKLVEDIISQGDTHAD
jgi:dephospho-CoA kinase